MDTSILRSARVGRGMTVQAVADLTKLPPRTVAAIENGRLDNIPAGVYARAYVRMYAQAVGIGDPSVISSIVDAIPKVDLDLETIVKCREAAIPPRLRTRTAAAVDAAIVSLLSACGVLVCVALTGAAAWDVGAITIAFFTLAAPTLVLYFALLGATGVGTAGACLFRVDFVAVVNGPLDGGLLARRTYEYVRSEAIALFANPTMARAIVDGASSTNVRS
jgi:transcriptional regulator with XRE-family HTH domain